MTPEKENKKGGTHLRGGIGSPKKPKKPLTAKQKTMRVVYIVVTVLAALIVTVFAVSKLLFVKPSVDVGKRPDPPAVSGTPDGEEEGTLPSISTSGRKEDFFTFLIIGRDTGGGGNTDVVMLAAYDVPSQKLNVMSIPRDTMVNVPWDIKRINSVYNQRGGGDKGIQALYNEVSQLVGFIPDYSVVVEWEAVGKMADAIGGVDFNVPINMDYDDPTQDLHIHIKKGQQHLDGEGVMKVLRFRDGNHNTGYVTGDIGRIETQQKLLKAIVEQLLNVRDPGTIMDLAGVFAKNVTTKLSVQNLFWFGKQAILGTPPMSIDNVNFVTMPCTNAAVWSRSFAGKSYQFQSYVVPNTNELVDVVNENFNPYLDDLVKKELDIMYVNKDGTIGSSSGVLEDTKHNSAWLAYKNKPKATPKPTSTGQPKPSTSPEITESPKPEVPTSPAVTPGQEGEGTPTPVITATPTPTTTQPEATATPPAETPAPTPPPAVPTADTGSQDEPPEGIPTI